MTTCINARYERVPIIGVWSNYCLDGEPIQWLVCALYQCVKQKAYIDSATEAVDVPTVISLSRLLKLSGVSLVQVRVLTDLLI